MPRGASEEARKHAIDVRRQIAGLRRAGVTDQTAIANQLGVSKSTVNRHMTALNAQLKADAKHDVEVERQRDVERIEHLIQALWPAATRSMAQGGPVFRAVMEIRGLMQHRAALLGLLAAEEHVHRFPDGTPGIIVNTINYNDVFQTILPPDLDDSPLVLDHQPNDR